MRLFIIYENNNLRLRMHVKIYLKMLGPILFKMYINDIIKPLQHSKIRLYVNLYFV